MVAARRLLYVVSAVLLVAVLLGARGAGAPERPASAASGGVVSARLVGSSVAVSDAVTPAGVFLSRDGVTWAADIEAPLFLTDLAWQPGDVRTSTLWVRNTAPETRELDVVLDRRAASDPATDAVVSMSGRLPGDDWLPLEPGGSSQVVRLGELATGEWATVTLRTSLAAGAAPGTEVDTDALQVRVRADVRREAGGEPAGAGWLSDAHLELAPIFLGLGLILAVVASRRRGRGDPPLV